MSLLHSQRLKNVWVLIFYFISFSPRNEFILGLFEFKVAFDGLEEASGGGHGIDIGSLAALLFRSAISGH